MESHTGREAIVAALTGGAAGHILKTEAVARTVNKLVVDGDTAVAFQHLKADLVNAGAYENEYAWRYTCANGKITGPTTTASTSSMPSAIRRSSPTFDDRFRSRIRC